MPPRRSQAQPHEDEDQTAPDTRPGLRTRRQAAQATSAQPTGPPHSTTARTVSAGDQPRGLRRLILPIPGAAHGAKSSRPVQNTGPVPEGIATGRTGSRNQPRTGSSSTSLRSPGSTRAGPAVAAITHNPGADDSGESGSDSDADPPPVIHPHAGTARIPAPVFDSDEMQFHLLQLHPNVQVKVQPPDNAAALPPHPSGFLMRKDSDILPLKTLFQTTGQPIANISMDIVNWTGRFKCRLCP
ncbi:hypothetical protein B0H16DRAFT_1473982 [Mycena metata]|uniref:Uncharacterized protein n=1 Tax=Mycena metata TaxID=1033252 RepID=A0AAD7HI83_9AGAR|nr:hypothetical protein B0H16DRAFT_1473982 [Mycena metata]